jgi:hypothetical protein
MLKTFDPVHRSISKCVCVYRQAVPMEFAFILWANDGELLKSKRTSCVTTVWEFMREQVKFTPYTGKVYGGGVDRSIHS